MIVETERMSDFFSKYNLRLGKSRITLHHFTAPDQGDAHDHPLDFTTTILVNGYWERIWRWRPGSGAWQSFMVWRAPGTTHTVKAHDVHQIVELPGGDCVTSVVWKDNMERRQPRFWRFSEGGHVAESRQWDETEWKKQ